MIYKKRLLTNLGILFIFSIFLLLTLFSKNTYSQIIDIADIFHKAGSAECFASGQVMLPVGARSINKLDLIKGIGARFNNTGAYIELKGGWYDYSYQKTEYAWIDKPTFFVSDEFMLNNNGNYTIVLAGIPIPILPFYSDIRTLEFSVECPGYKHKCNVLNLKILDCYLDNITSKVYIQFIGIGEKNYSYVKPDRDMEFYLLMDNTITKITNYSISRRSYEEDYAYILSAAINTSVTKTNTLSGVIANISGCINKLHNISYYKICKTNQITSINQTNLTFVNISFDTNKMNVIQNLSIQNFSDNASANLNISIQYRVEQSENIFQRLYLITKNFFKNIIKNFST